MSEMTWEVRYHLLRGEPVVADLDDALPGNLAWVSLYHLDPVHSKALHVLKAAELGRVQVRRFEIPQSIIDNDWDPAGEEQRDERRIVHGQEALIDSLKDYGLTVDDLMPAFKNLHYPF